jgi:hypothetical protein
MRIGGCVQHTPGYGSPCLQKRELRWGIMAIAFNRSREALAKVRRNSGRCLVVHYACQSLYDDRDSLSPSISNIVVKNWENDQTVSFAAHLAAEKMHIEKDEIESRFLEIETRLLEDFFIFVQSHSGNLWLH